MDMTLQEAVDKFNDAYYKAKEFWDTKSDFYCGITNDLERRNREHGIDNVLYWVKTDCFETAKSLEDLLHNAGYDTGEQIGNGTEDSTIVYMYRKTTKTKE